jgi:TRAP-type C4-dicarboxylate transport system permease small subunit
MMRKAMEKITSAFTVVSAVMFAVIVTIVLVNIVGRAVFNEPVKGTVEIVQYGVMFCAGIVMCRSGLDERHISVTFLIDKYPARLRAIFLAFGKLLGTATFGVLAYIYAGKIREAVEDGKLTDTFRMPFEYVYLIMALCFLAGALVFFYQFCLAASHVIKPPPPENAVKKDGETEALSF